MQRNACFRRVAIGLAATWAVAVIGLGAVLLGDAGIGYALAVIAGGLAVLAIRRTLASIIIGLFIPVWVLVTVTAPSGTPSWMHRHLKCMNRLYAIGLAINRYADEHGHYPPAVVCDEHGMPMHSWRVLLLPYLSRLDSDGGAGDTYADVSSCYRWNEPWNSPHNATLAERVDAYRCAAQNQHRSRHPHATPFLAAVGQRAWWSGATPRQPDDIRDGLQRTACVIEATPIHNWMEPADLSVEAAAGFFASTLSEHRIPSNTVLWDASIPLPRLVLMGDGHVERVAVNQPLERARAALDVADGKPGTDEECFRVHPADTGWLLFFLGFLGLSAAPAVVSLMCRMFFGRN
jgi:hypothetical protein